jgi:hypothetical protein
LYHEFIISTGYTDYENADISDTLYNYGMDDNKGGWIGLHIPWKKLVYKLYDVIGHNHFKFSSDVISVQKIKDSPCLFEIKTQNNKTYYSNKVIVATNITGIKTIVPGASKQNSIYQQIHGQPFLRLYAKFDKKSSEIMKNYVIYANRENYDVLKTFVLDKVPLQNLILLLVIGFVFFITFILLYAYSKIKFILKITINERLL